MKKSQTRRCTKCGITFDVQLPPVSELEKFFDENPHLAPEDPLCEACNAEFELWWAEMTPERRASIMQEALKLAYENIH